MLEYRENLVKQSCLAGILISLAGALYLNCSDKTVGAFLFSIGLAAVIVLGANLYTGKIGYINSKADFGNAYVMLVINSAIACVCGIAYYLAGYTNAVSVVDSKLSKSVLIVLFASILCGMCIYLAVEGYKKSKSLLFVVLGVMGFILGGGEHVIADAFYIGASGSLTLKGLAFLVLVAIGNSFGSLIIRVFQYGFKIKELE